MRAGEAGRRRAERERHQLEPVDRHAHQLGRERVLAQRAPRAPRARVVDEAKRDQDDDEERERDVEVPDVEDPAMRDRQVVAEDVERVERGDPVRAVREVDPEEGVAVDHEHEEGLEEEQRHDRQVVAG